jgi:hypothetical protein
MRRLFILIADTIKALPLAFGASSGDGGTSANVDSDEEGEGAAGIFANNFNTTLRCLVNQLVDEAAIDVDAIELRLTECRLAAGGNTGGKVILGALIGQILPKLFSRYVALEQNQRTISPAHSTNCPLLTCCGIWW